MNKRYISLLTYITFVFSAEICAVIAEWSGTSIFDVFNQDLIIKGDCQFTSDIGDTVQVVADTTDVTIYMDADALIRANPENGVENIIYLTAKYPYTITIKVDHHLRFKGAFCTLDQPFKIIEQGTGSIEWEINPDGGKLEFTADDSSSGTELWIEFGFIYDTMAAPEHEFIVTKKNQVFFGPRSGWGYRVIGCNDDDTAEAVIEKNNTDDDHETFFGFKDFSSFALEVYED